MGDDMTTVLITGATGGIGAMIAERLAAEGYCLILVGRNEQALLSLKNKLSTLSSDITIMAIDVSDYAAVQNALKSITNLDILITSAGILGPVAPFTQVDMDFWLKTININLLGTVYFCKLLIPVLQKSSHGKIITFAGGGAVNPRIQHSAYATSKAAVVRFTETIAAEYPLLDINVIAPGAHHTKIWDTETFDKPPEKWADSVRLQDFFAFLCSEKSNGITGRYIHAYDDWDKKDFRKIPEDLYTMRRVDERLLQKFM